MFFEYWLERARKGDGFAARLMWSSLSSAVNDRRLTAAQWALLAELLAATTAKRPSNKLAAAANRALSLGRRPGPKQKYEAEEHWFRLASEVFDAVGEARGDALDDACDVVLRRLHGVGNPDTARDLRKIKKAYFSNLPHFIEMQRLSRESANRTD